jgi:hypothetical protein
MGQRWLSGGLARLRIQDDGRCLGVVESTCTAKGVGGPRTGIVAGGHGNGRPGRARVIATTSRSRTEAFRVDYVRMAAAQPTPEQGIDLDGGRLGVRQSVLCGLGLY